MLNKESISTKTKPSLVFSVFDEAVFKILICVFLNIH